jgi:hypothetical protein
MAEAPDSVEDLTREIARLQIQLSAAQAKLVAAERTEANERTSRADVYASGDRVRIVNKVIRPAQYEGEWNEAAQERERRATVTHTVAARPKTPLQVWILTDNGTITWRAAKHLKRETNRR